MNKHRFIVLALVLVFASVLAMPATADTILGVPFLKQFWNSDTCGHGSCGPASLAMCSRYIYGLNNIGGSAVVQDMIDIWDYLGGDLDGNDPNGTSRTQLVNSAHGVFGINGVYGSTMTVSSVKSEIAAGRPVVLHVVAGYLSNRGYSYSGGHWIAAVGYNDGYVICNDPGTYLGEHKYYSNSDVTSAMAARSNEVVRGFLRPVEPPTRPTPPAGVHVQYIAHCSSIGWQTWCIDGPYAGTVGQNKAMEALVIYSPNTTINYIGHVSYYGWQNWKNPGQICGTTGLNRKLEAVEITCGPGYSISYQAHVSGIGWQSVVSNGALAGTTGQGRQIEAIRIWLTAL